MKVHPFTILQFEGDFRTSKYPNQRYGQAFCNTFNIDDSKLFYEPDKKQAQEIVWTEYVK